LKILFVIPEYYPHSGGGISTYYLNYIKALRQHGVEIRVIVGSGFTQSDEVFDLDGVTIEYLKPNLFQHYLTKFTLYDLLSAFKRDLASAWAMWQQASEYADFDLVECTDFGLGFVPWIINRNKPVVTRLHGSAGQIALHETGLTDSLESLQYQQAELLLLPKCDQLVTHSAANKKVWDDAFGAGTVRLIYPVFDNVTDPLPLDKRMHLGLVTARIQRWKGPVELCEAYKTLSAPALFTPIKWYGRDTPYQGQQTTDEYLKFTYPAIWGKFILPEVPLANPEIARLQQTVKFGLVPSTWDMFNFSLVEFTSAGTPVICSDGAGASELIRHGENGFKYPANDKNALADCITAMANINNATYATMSDAAMKTIKNELSAGVLVPINLSLYKQLIADFKPKNASIYLSQLYQPSDKQHQFESLLDMQPLKRLSRYYYKRIKSKISKG